MPALKFFGAGNIGKKQEHENFRYKHVEKDNYLKTYDTGNIEIDWHMKRKRRIENVF